MRAGVEVGKVRGTLIPTQFKPEETFLALLFFFSFYATHLSVKSQVMSVYERVWRLTLKSDSLPTCSDGSWEVWKRSHPEMVLPVSSFCFITSHGTRWGKCPL